MRRERTKIILTLTLLLILISCSSSEQLLDPMLSLQSRQTLYNPDTLLTDNNIKAQVALHQGIHDSVHNSLQIKYSGLLNVSPALITNHSLYNFIDNWYGVRYRLGGNDTSGIDCSGFALRLYESVFCKSLVRTTMEQFSKYRFVTTKDRLEEGDLIFFRLRGRKRISHVGVYLMNSFFVHASSTQGVMISSLKEDYWSRTYVGAGKVLN